MPPRKLDDITIPNTQTDSPIIDLRKAPYAGLTHLVIYSPTFSETITVRSAKDASSTFGIHQAGGSDITLASDKRTTVDVRGIGALRIVAGAGVTGAKTFGLSGGEPEPT